MPATPRSPASEIWYDCRAVLRPLGGVWVRSLLAFAMVTLAIWLAVHPYDHAWLTLVQGDHTHLVLASWISNQGEFHILNLGFAVSFWLVGKLRRNRYIRRLAVASLLSGAVAGLACDVLHVTCGRPRPRAFARHANVSDRFTGPTLQSDFQSFASAHSAACSGSSTPVLLAMPEVGLPAVLVTGAVGWSRIYGNHHYPTDVLVGMTLGFFVGLPSGLRLRKLGKRASRMRAAARAHGGQ
jgi:undecaprenyl-diphosphatase